MPLLRKILAVAWLSALTLCAVAALGWAAWNWPWVVVAVVTGVSVFAGLNWFAMWVDDRRGELLSGCIFFAVFSAFPFVDPVGRWVMVALWAIAIVGALTYLSIREVRRPRTSVAVDSSHKADSSRTVA
jgi:hypothetical protein